MRIYVDIHKYGVDPVEGVDMSAAPSGSVFLGDCVDAKNCLRKLLSDMYASRAELMSRRDCFYITGNHEKLPPTGPHVVNGVCLDHGDVVLWGEKRAMEARIGKLDGCGRFLRFFKMIGSKWRNVFGCSLDDDEKDKLAELATSLKCHTIVIGHKHPKTTMDIVHKQVRIVVLPRGEHDFDEKKVWWKLETGGGA